jgi:hypothetical protein
MCNDSRTSADLRAVPRDPVRHPHGGLLFHLADYHRHSDYPAYYFALSLMLIGISALVISSAHKQTGNAHRPTGAAAK